jgi:hypothetical protein
LTRLLGKRPPPTVSVLLIAALCSFAAFLGGRETSRNDTNAVARRLAVAACQRGNKLRADLNRRVISVQRAALTLAAQAHPNTLYSILEARSVALPTVDCSTVVAKS